MRDGKFGFGLVGIGMGGVTHATQFAVMEDVEFVACYGRNPEKAAAAREGEVMGADLGAKP